MSSTIFSTIRMLEEAGLHYFIERSRPDSIRLTVTMVGQRVEIDVFEDNHIEVSQFFGNESVESGSESLKKLLKSD